MRQLSKQAIHFPDLGTREPRASRLAMLFNVWSGPRCCSTALMYSFAQRTDTVVEDEPLYAAYLSLTGASRPYTEQVRDPRC